MVIDKTLSIFHFEDDKPTQLLIKKTMLMEFNAIISAESTLMNLDMYFDTHFMDDIDIIICDVCFPTESAISKIKTLARSKKPIIFNTSLDEDVFYEMVWDKLKDIPKNFHFIRKATTTGTRDLILKVRELTA